VGLDWVLFDLNGTLLDPGGVGEPLGMTAEQSIQALDTAILLSMAETLSGGYRPFTELLRAALGQRATGRTGALDEAVERAGRMPAYADAPAALTRIRAAGLRGGVLTNSGTAAAREAVEAAGLADGIDLVVGSDEVEAFKPDPRLYAHGLRATGAEPREACLVAAHGWDVMGAGRAGMRTAWVARKEQRLAETVPEPDVRAESLEQAAERLAELAHV
jgi:2-haloacid dehalogenase